MWIGLVTSNMPEMKPRCQLTCDLPSPHQGPQRQQPKGYASKMVHESPEQIQSGQPYSRVVGSSNAELMILISGSGGLTRRSSEDDMWILGTLLVTASHQRDLLRRNAVAASPACAESQKGRGVKRWLEKRTIRTKNRYEGRIRIPTPKANIPWKVPVKSCADALTDVSDDKGSPPHIQHVKSLHSQRCSGVCTCGISRTIFLLVIVKNATDVHIIKTNSSPCYDTLFFFIAIIRCFEA